MRGTAPDDRRLHDGPHLRQARRVDRRHGKGGSLSPRPRSASAPIGQQDTDDHTHPLRRHIHHSDRARSHQARRASLLRRQVPPLPRHHPPHASTRLSAARRHRTALAWQPDHPSLLRLPPPRHGVGNHGCGTQRQLCQRQRPRQRMAHHPTLGHRAAEESQWPHLLPPRRQSAQPHRSHPVARGRRRSQQEPVQEDGQG